MVIERMGNDQFAIGECIKSEQKFLCERTLKNTSICGALEGDLEKGDEQKQPRETRENHRGAMFRVQKCDRKT